MPAPDPQPNLPTGGESQATDVVKDDAKKPAKKPARKPAKKADSTGGLQPNKRGLVAVKLRRSYERYNAGETVGVKPALAKALLGGDDPVAELPE